MIALTALGIAALAAWAYLIVGRGLFWLARERDTLKPSPSAPKAWPSVAAVVPARDEADVIARSIGSLVNQDYPGSFRVILVDDASSDGTAAVARSDDSGERLTVVAGTALPPGWTGKLWAMRQGIDEAGDVDYLLFTDADIAHAPDNLRRLVARAEAGDLVLVSQMAKLSTQTAAERMLIPAFVFFFAMLYPFAWVNNPRHRLAAAAGGVMLTRRDALSAAGGLESIAHEIIDDCALARRMKAQGPIWLSLTDRAHSLRPYRSIGEIGRMISRSAYAQLGYSPLLLAATVVGMVVVYLAAPFLTLFGAGLARLGGVMAWIAMDIAFQPILTFYRRSPLWGPILPVIGALYTLFTVKSAVDVWRGKGGMWKGRAQAMAPLT